MARSDEAECDGAIERGREATRGDAADADAVLVENRGVLACRRALDEEADANPGQLSAELGGDTIGAGEVPGLTAALADGEIEPSLDRRHGVVEVVPVKRQSSLEPQAVAGTEADRLDAGIG